MIRSRRPEIAAAAVALAVVLAGPAPAHAQEEEEAQEQVQQQVPEGEHEVVRGNTLWDLAAQFYGDPYQWPVIHEANRDRVVDPHWIYPGQILIIPGLEGEADQEVMVARADPVRMPGTGAGDRTVFYSAGSGEEEGVRVVGLPPSERFAVSPDDFHSAPWLRALGQESTAIGRVVGFTGGEQQRSNLQTAKPFDRLRVVIDGGPMIQVGMMLQTFRVAREIPELGNVMVPTGLLTVAAIEEAGVVGVVSREYDRLRVGDVVRLAPRFPMELGVHPLDVTGRGGPMATIVTFGDVHQLYNEGDIAILDVGRVDGVQVGDEFVHVANHGRGWSGEVEGRVRVVSVQEEHASARIVDLRNPVFREGVELIPSRQMP